MKKKILLFFIVTCALACMLAISAIASEMKTIDGITYYLDNGVAEVNNGKTCALETVFIPETIKGSDQQNYTVTSIKKQAFQNNKNIRYVSLPATINYIGEAAFHTCSSLIFVDFNDNANEITLDGYGIFRNCSSLKAICLPDGIKSIPDQFLTNATELTAVYLPKSIEYIRGNKTANDGPAFGNSQNMYFVNEKFSVRDRNGDFYTADTFTPPEKPLIYYFPESLIAITGAQNTNGRFTMDENGIVKNTGYEDCAFYNLPNINSILVLPEGYHGFDDRSVSNSNAQITDFRGDTITSGLFQKCGTKTSPLTVVFLGKIDRVSMDRKNGGSSYTTYVFANEANTGFENTKIGSFTNGTDSSYSNQNEMYVVFCHANNGEGAKYKVNFVGQDGNKTYPVLKSTLVTDASGHLIDHSSSQVVVPASCLTNMVANAVCFCGKAMGSSVTVEGTKLGHEFDLEDGATEHSVLYTDYFKSGVYNVKCARCNELDGIAAKPIFFNFKGYSTKEGSNKISIGYTYNIDALEQYERVNKEPLEVGFVFAIKSYLGERLPLEEDGSVMSLDKGNVVKVVADVKSAWGFDFVISADWNKTVNINGQSMALKDLELFFCAYVYDGSVSYLYNGAKPYISYSQI